MKESRTKIWYYPINRIFYFYTSRLSFAYVLGAFDRQRNDSFVLLYLLGVIIILVDQLPRTLGELKQSIMRENNLVNQLIFKVGLTEQQISLMDNKIIIIAKHKRIPVLEIIESSSDSLAEIIDRLLIDKYKELLLRNLEEKLHFNVQLILKDYDSMKEISGTIIVLDKKIESYLAG